MKKEITLDLEIGEEFKFSDDKIHKLYQDLVEDCEQRNTHNEISQKIEEVKKKISIQRERVYKKQKEIQELDDEIREEKMRAYNLKLEDIKMPAFIQANIECCFAGYLLMETDIIDQVESTVTPYYNYPYRTEVRTWSSDEFRSWHIEARLKVILNPKTTYLIDEGVNLDEIREEYETYHRPRILQESIPLVEQEIKEHKIDKIEKKKETRKKKLDELRDGLRKLQHERDNLIRKLYHTASDRSTVAWSDRTRNNIYPDAIPERNFRKGLSSPFHSVKL